MTEGPTTAGPVPQYKALDTGPLAGGLVDAIDATLIQAGESPNCLNVDFDRGSVATTRGSRKFNNQTAPSSAPRFRPDPGYSPLFFQSGYAVPLRSYGYLPYVAELDIGGRADFEGSFPSTVSYHNRRGRSFQIRGSFHLPIEEKLYEAETRGANAPAVGSEPAACNPPHGFDEALDECFLVLQKGGDRLAHLSWALGVVNVGKLVSGDGTGTNLPATRPSNYALVLMWYDGAEWGQYTPASMMYSLTTGVIPTSGSYSTQAFRAIVFHQWVEPGKKYHFSLGLSMDTGTCGGIGVATDWNHDGVLVLNVKDETGTIKQSRVIDSSSGATYDNAEVWKGPQDSGSYFCKYGIRYHGLDAVYAGLGCRFLPWKRPGFISYGADLTPLSSGGFRMMDRSAITVNQAEVYNGDHTLCCWKAANGDAYLKINHDGFSGSNTNGGIDPSGPYSSGYITWVGQGPGALPFNSEGLRGYRMVFAGDTVGISTAKGAVFSILSYTRAGAGDYRVTIQGGTGINAFASSGTPKPVLIQAFRWHQRALDIQDISIWSERQELNDTDELKASRRRWSLGHSLRPDDPLEADIEHLLAYYKFDDAGGYVLRESVQGGIRNGFIAPYGLGVSDGGVRGKSLVFLSGEGEAVKIDFSANPIVKRELLRMMRGATQGVAVEFSCVFPEATYGIESAPVQLPDDSTSSFNGSRARFAPRLVEWSVPEPDASGLRVRPRPIIALTQEGLDADSGSAKYRKPLAFQVEVATRSDQDNVDPVIHQNLQPWYASGGSPTNRFDTDAPWVGKHVTIQFGIQSTGTDDQYDVYLAMTPKDAFQKTSGDPGDAEFQLWTDGTGTYDNAYFTSAHITIKRKDLERSIITIGGGWYPGGKGFTELNARILLDEVRIFFTPGPGALSTASNSYVVNRDGKLEGSKCLPPRKLSETDLLLPLGRNTRFADVTQNSATVEPSGGGRFFTGSAAASVEAVKDCYLMARGDKFHIPSDETDGTVQERLYGVTAVASDGTNLTISSKYADASRSRARTDILRCMAYTAFEDGIEGAALELPVGAAFNPDTYTTSDIVESRPLWENKAPITCTIGIRLMSPGIPPKDILARWVRGLVSPRRGKIGEGVLGVAAVNEKLYAAVQGALYEGDDRWREGTEDVSGTSLDFRGALSDAGVVLPLQDDRVVFTDFDGFTPLVDATDTTQRIYDAEVLFERGLDEYQTIAWLGASDGNPALYAGNGTLENAVSLILRLNRGRPEIVIGSTAYYTSTTQPEKGLFIATASSSVEEGSKTHIRWYLYGRDGGAILQKPLCYINGKQVSVSVNATDNDASITEDTDWLRTSTIVSPGNSGVVAVGAGRDSYRSPSAAGAIGTTDEIIAPQRIQGWMHSLNGRLFAIVVGTEPIFTGTAPEEFDSKDIDYSDLTGTWMILGSQADGRGHKVREQIGGSKGTIYSHPFISLFHELGRTNSQASFAQFASQLYVTTGGRPAVVLADGTARFAGLKAPGAKPDFSITRLPIWKPNTRDQTSSNNPNNDPLNATSTSQDVIYHYRNDGNVALTQVIDTSDLAENQWDKNDYWYFKELVRFDSVEGRINLTRKGKSKESGGPFIECRDGTLYLGWYDVNSKTERSVHTSKPVFRPGYVYYIYARKMYPQGDALEGNWRNSYFTNGAIRRMTITSVTGTFAIGDTITDDSDATITGLIIKALPKVAATQTVEYIKTGNNFGGTGALTASPSGATGNSAGSGAGLIIRPMNDVLVVREFPTSLPSPYHELDAKIAASGASINRAAISLTTTLSNPTGTTAIGLVTAPGLVFDGSATAGRVIEGTGNIECFTPDMVGMFWQWGSAAGVGVTVYRIVSYTNSHQIGVQNLDGTTAPSWAGVADKPGGVFHGVELVKSSDFDAAGTPDNTSDTIEMNGTVQARDPLCGYAPFVGDFWCPAHGVDQSASTNRLEGALPFENVDSSIAGGATVDPISIGADDFQFALYNGAGGQVGELRADDNRLFWGADLRGYGGGGGNISTIPNIDRKVAKDTSPSCTALSASDPAFQYVQDPSVWKTRSFSSVAYRDSAQGVVSNPSPALTISPATEDPLNPSGTVRVTLKNLPASPELTDDLEMLIFKSISSVNGDGTIGTPGVAEVQREVRAVPDGTREVAVDSIEALNQTGDILELNNAVPPDCSVIAMAQDRMFFGDLEQQSDGIRFSKPFEPALAPELNFFRANSGAGAAVTGLRELDGQLVATKRDSVFAITIDSASQLPLQRIVSTGVGCSAAASMVGLDHSIVWRGDWGLYGYQRAYDTSLVGQANALSTKIKNYFRTTADKRYADRSSAVFYRQRSQYICTIKATDDTVQRERVSAMGDTFSRYRDPNVSALCVLQPESGGLPRLVGGTEDGFLVWLDDETTNLNMLEADAATTLTVETDSGLGAIEVSDTIDGSLESLRGTVARWNASGVEYEARVLGYDGGFLHLEEAAGAIPGSATPLLLGGQQHVWESKWFDFGMPQQRKKTYFLDLVFADGSEGYVLVEVMVDRNEAVRQTKKQADGTTRIPTGTRKFTIPIQPHGNWIKVRISSHPDTVGGSWELTNMILRAGETDNS